MDPTTGIKKIYLLKSDGEICLEFNYDGYQGSAWILN